ncbi:metal-dependent hydrolase [Clostridium sp. CCUG 7971]|uniref:metal-dependent hydrolase n=1 Tax=Clostridium sp. CCUG 7971 TaxID=2811414 RepID=UPI001ABB0FC1|nr:metal-dependent hydrolase [Clostridium sp. CCUG 7971]MBO3442940.1 metal-dependent hydrolase [Clostridium sp. CCUG 7971]
MVKETHIKGGYIFALLALPFINNKFLVGYDLIYKLILISIYIYFSYIGSLFPDIDMRGSYISKRYPILYKKIGSKFKHRGFTHSLIFISFLCYIFGLLVKFSDNNIVFLCLYNGFIIGYISHLCLDIITKEGIQIFYPICINFSLLPIKTSSKCEKIICKALNFVFIFLLGYRFYILF